MGHIVGQFMKREAALAGRGRYNAPPSPDGLSEVSSDKAIGLYRVVMAGRTLDDLAESKLKHEFTWNGNVNIHKETGIVEFGSRRVRK
jgi:hypothetical protein